MKTPMYWYFWNINISAAVKREAATWYAAQIAALNSRDGKEGKV